MCSCISKLVLVVVNSVFALFSLIVAGIGIYVAVQRGKTAPGYSDSVKDEEWRFMLSTMRYMTPAIILIAVGFICLVISISGCVGAMKESQCLLTTYSVILGLLLVLQIVAIGLAVAYRSKIEDRIAKALSKADSKFFMPFNTLKQKGKLNDTDAISHAINYFQLTMKCCGSQNYTDITNKETKWSQAKPTLQSKEMKLPMSCCKFTDEGVKALSQTTNWTNAESYLVAKDKCPLSEESFYAEGCMPAFMDNIKNHVITICVACGIYVCFNLLCIIMACCLIRQNKETQQYRD